MKSGSRPKFLSRFRAPEERTQAAFRENEFQRTEMEPNLTSEELLKTRPVETERLAEPEEGQGQDGVPQALTKRKGLKFTFAPRPRLVRQEDLKNIPKRAPLKPPSGGPRADAAATTVRAKADSIGLGFERLLPEGLSFRSQRIKRNPGPPVPSSPRAPFSDSPERMIGTVIIGNDEVVKKTDRTPPSAEYYRELTKASKPLGFQVVKGWNTEIDGQWLRDTQIGLSNGGFLIPNALAKDEKFDQDMEHQVREMIAQDTYLRQANLPDMGNVVNKVFERGNLALDAENWAESQKLPVKHGNTLIEGGNLIAATKRDGSSGVIVGEASLVQSCLRMARTGLLPQERVAEKAKALRRQGINAQLKEELNRKIASANTDATNLVATGKDAAIQWLAEMAVTREMMAEDLEVPANGLIVVDQPAFHLDMGMAAGPGGMIFIQDHAKSAAHCNFFLKNYRDEMTKDEVALLERYRDNAAASAKDLAKGYDRIENQLKQAGYGVVRLPAAFTEATERTMGVNRHAANSKPINYLNHIAGTSPDHQMFYITNGAAGRLGALFNRYIEFTLKSLGYDTVLFLGSDGTASKSLQEAGGLRCLTTVLPPKTAVSKPGAVSSHIDGSEGSQGS